MARSTTFGQRGSVHQLIRALQPISHHISQSRAISLTKVFSPNVLRYIFALFICYNPQTMSEKIYISLILLIQNMTVSVCRESACVCVERVRVYVSREREMGLAYAVFQISRHDIFARSNFFLSSICDINSILIYSCTYLHKILFYIWCLFFFYADKAKRHEVFSFPSYNEKLICCQMKSIFMLYALCTVLTESKS